ncbi:MAG: type II secretion system F family protein [Candidatus Bathyarchaeia archaeon]
MAKPGFTFSGFAYAHFRWMGRAVGRVFKPEFLTGTLEAADIRIYPEAYACMIGFLMVLTPIIATVLTLVVGTLFMPEYLEFPLVLAVIPIIAATPFITLALGYFVPKTMALNRASNLDVEMPYASAYISVMATGGVSPYASMQRLRKFGLLPNIQKAAGNMDLDVRAMGLDPIAAMEKSARHLPSKDYKDLLFGYASTVRSGGDVVHYLLMKTESMFRDQAVKLKAMGERIGTLMEVYIAISILAALSLYAIYTTSLAFSGFFTMGMFSTASFILFGYVLLPVISILFIYMADASQPHHPVNEWTPIKVYLATMPLMLGLILAFALPNMLPELRGLPAFAPFQDFLVWFRNVLGLERGYEAALGFSLAFIIGTAPAAVAHHIYAKRNKGVEADISNFLRDLVEVRKTGLSPEKCIEHLADRTYGKLTPYLKVISRQLRWGLPLRTIYDTFAEKVRSWLALVNMFLLVDAVEVGGGDPETLDDLATFSEMTASLEKEKKVMLRPLLFIPYIGAGILLFSVIIFLGYMRSVLKMFGRMAMPYADFITLLLPPLIIHVYIAGLVTGKMSSGEVSAGFKHAILLTVAGLVTVVFSPLFMLPLSEIGGTPA